LKKLAIITTHPIQYYAPVFRLLHQRGAIEIKVFYTRGEMENGKQQDPGFGKAIEWDLPLLDGYPYEWVKNTACDPGSHHFNGIKNPELIKQLADWQPDALLVFGWAWQSHLKVMRFFKGRLPVYFRGDSTLLDNKGNFRSLIKKWFLTWVYKHTAGAFYTGVENKKYFRQYGLKESQLIFAPHAVDNNRFAEDRSVEVMELRNELGIGSNELLVLFAGKFEEKKDPFILLQAFLMLNNPGIHLLFVGNGVLEMGLKSHASTPLYASTQLYASTPLSMTGDSTPLSMTGDPVSYTSTPLSMTDPLSMTGDPISYTSTPLSMTGEPLSMTEAPLKSLQRSPFGQISPKVPKDSYGESFRTNLSTGTKGLLWRVLLDTSQTIHFMEFQNQTQMPVIYQACDLFCLPSKGPGESWGLAVNEAMACGKAILVSDKVGCASDLVIRLKNGQIFKSENVTDLKEKLHELTNDQSRLKEMGQKSKEIIHNFNFERIAIAIEEQVSLSVS
jgi:glycosyltransferase involved in cell wall biosynthesis